MFKQEELNVMFRDYYSVMEDIEPDRLDRRIQLANDLYDVIIVYYVLLEGNESQEVIENQLANEMYSTIAKYGEIDDYTSELVDLYTKDIVKANMSHKSSEYYVSDERAVNIAQDVGQSFLNYFEYQDAVANNKSKTWFTQNDMAVRPTHATENGKQIPIDETFKVGGYLMRFPKDTYYGAPAEEIVNCRCFVKYS